MDATTQNDSVPPTDPAWAGRIAAIDSAADESAAWGALDAAQSGAGDDLDRWVSLAERADGRKVLDRWVATLEARARAEGDAPAWIGLMAAHLQAGRLGDAYEAARRARDAQRPATDAWQLHPVWWGMRAQRWNDVLADLDQVARHAAGQPDEPDMASWLAMHRAICLGRLDRHDEAMAQLAGLPVPLPAASSYSRVEGDACLEWVEALLVGNRFEEAVRVTALMQGWDVPADLAGAALVQQLGALLRLQRSAEMVEPLQRLQALADNAQGQALVAFFDAVLQEEGGRHEAALTQARAALAAVDDGTIPPTYGPLMRLVAGRSLIALGRAAEALPLLDAAAGAGNEPPVVAEAQFQRAVALLAGSEPAQAEEALKALDLASAAGPDPRRQADWLRGKALAALGRHREAHDAFAAAARTGASALDRAVAWLMAAGAARACSDDPAVRAAATEAARESEAAHAETPADNRAADFWAAAQFHLALAAYRLQQPQAALDALEALRQRAPGADGAILWQVIRIESLFALERRAEAGAAAREALGLAGLAGHAYLLYLAAEAERGATPATAFEALQQGARDVPAALDSDLFAHLGQMACNLSLGRATAAKAAAERLLARDPGSARHPLVRLCGITLRLGANDNPQAEADLADLDDLVAKAPNQARMLAVGRGILLMQAGRLDEAGAVLAAVADRADAALPPGMRLQARLLHMRVLQQQGRHDEAVQGLRTLDGEPALDPMGRTMQGLARLTLAGIEAADGRADAALQAARRAEAVLSEGSIATDGADGPINLLLQQARLQQAHALLHLGRPEESLSHLAKLGVVRSTRGAILALHLRSLCEAAVEDWPAAAATARRFRAALAEHPERAELNDLHLGSLVEEAEAHLRQMAWPDAVQVLQQALAEHGDEALQRVRLWWRLGRAYLGMGRIQPARQTLRRAQGLLGKVKSGALQRAVGDSLAAVDLLADDPAAALATLAAADRAGPAGPAAWFNRGAALLALHRRENDEARLDQAREAFAQARRAGHEGAAKLARQIARREAREGGWPAYWFGANAGAGRRLLGALLAGASLALVFGPPGWAMAHAQAVDWKLLALPTVVVLALLLVPSLKSLTLGWGDAKLSAEAMAAPDAAAAVSTPVPPPDLTDVLMQGVEGNYALFSLDSLGAMMGPTLSEDLARATVEAQYQSVQGWGSTGKAAPPA